MKIKNFIYLKEIGNIKSDYIINFLQMSFFIKKFNFLFNFLELLKISKNLQSK